MHDTIVGIALKRAARMIPGHPLIERVVHEQVHQDRRNRRPLRSSLVPLDKDAVRVLQRGSEPPLHIQQHPAAVGDRLHRLDDEVPRHFVEELLDVEIDRPVVLPAPLPACLERVMGRASRPIAIGVGVKPRFRPLPQIRGHHRLRDPVCDRRHTEQTDPTAVRLGDLDRPDRGRKVRTRAHPVPDLVKVSLQIGLELVQVLPVHSRGTLVLLDLPPRLPHHQLGNHKRLVFGLWHVFSLPPRTQGPRLIEPTFLVSRPLRSTATPASSGLHSYYGPVRQRAPQPVLSAFGFRLGTLPLATVGAYDPGRHIDARLLTFRARAADQAHAASTPDTTWPIHGHPPGSSRRTHQNPRFRCHLKEFRRLNSARPARVSPAERFWNVFLVPT